ncbi:MAG: hypothetical protein HKL96_05195 [Phycisphaerales bacterium]|nr:hypothetical protein [Phycisphaerales bacterium]
MTSLSHNLSADQARAVVKMQLARLTRRVNWVRFAQTLQMTVPLGLLVAAGLLAALITDLTENRFFWFGLRALMMALILWAIFRLAVRRYQKDRPITVTGVARTSATFPHPNWLVFGLVAATFLSLASVDLAWHMGHHGMLLAALVPTGVLLIFIITAAVVAARPPQSLPQYIDASLHLKQSMIIALEPLDATGTPPLEQQLRLYTLQTTAIHMQTLDTRRAVAWRIQRQLLAASILLALLIGGLLAVAPMRLPQRAAITSQVAQTLGAIPRKNLPADVRAAIRRLQSQAAQNMSRRQLARRIAQIRRRLAQAMATAAAAAKLARQLQENLALQQTLKNAETSTAITHHNSQTSGQRRGGATAANSASNLSPTRTRTLAKDFNHIALQQGVNTPLGQAMAAVGRAAAYGSAVRFTHAWSQLQNLLATLLPTPDQQTAMQQATRTLAAAASQLGTTRAASRIATMPSPAQSNNGKALGSNSPPKVLGQGPFTKIEASGDKVGGSQTSGSTTAGITGYETSQSPGPGGRMLPGGLILDEPSPATGSTISSPAKLTVQSAGSPGVTGNVGRIPPRYQEIVRKYFAR